LKKEKKIPVEVYSRVVGYFRPVNQWNKGKKEEFQERNELKLQNIIKKDFYAYKGNPQNIFN